MTVFTHTRTTTQTVHVFKVSSAAVISTIDGGTMSVASAKVHSYPSGIDWVVFDGVAVTGPDDYPSTPVPFGIDARRDETRGGPDVDLAYEVIAAVVAQDTLVKDATGEEIASAIRFMTVNGIPLTPRAIAAEVKVGRAEAAQDAIADRA